jgi:hypothetical protein
MKFVSKFKLELPLAWQGLVALGHSILLESSCMSCRVGSNTELERGAAGGQPPSSLEETNSFPEQGKHRCIILV